MSGETTLGAKCPLCGAVITANQPRCVACGADLQHRAVVALRQADDWLAYFQANYGEVLQSYNEWQNYRTELLQILQQTRETDETDVTEVGDVSPSEPEIGTPDRSVAPASQWRFPNSTFVNKASATTGVDVKNTRSKAAPSPVTSATADPVIQAPVERSALEAISQANPPAPTTASARKQGHIRARLTAPVLLGIAGAALLIVAAVVFVAVTWETFPAVGQGSIILGLAGFVGALAVWLRHHDLAVTGGAVGIVAMAFGGLSVVGFDRVSRDLGSFLPVFVLGVSAALGWILAQFQTRWVLPVSQTSLTLALYWAAVATAPLIGGEDGRGGILTQRAYLYLALGLVATLVIWILAYNSNGLGRALLQYLAPVGLTVMGGLAAFAHVDSGLARSGAAVDLGTTLVVTALMAVIALWFGARYHPKLGAICAHLLLQVTVFSAVFVPTLTWSSAALGATVALLVLTVFAHLHPEWRSGSRWGAASFAWVFIPALSSFAVSLPAGVKLLAGVPVAKAQLPGVAASFIWLLIGIITLVWRTWLPPTALARRITLIAGYLTLPLGLFWGTLTAAATFTPAWALVTVAVLTGLLVWVVNSNQHFGAALAVVTSCWLGLIGLISATQLMATGAPIMALAAVAATVGAISVSGYNFRVIPVAVLVGVATVGSLVIWFSSSPAVALLVIAALLALLFWLGPKFSASKARIWLLASISALSLGVTFVGGWGLAATVARVLTGGFRPLDQGGGSLWVVAAMAILALGVAGLQSWKELPQIKRPALVGSAIVLLATVAILPYLAPSLGKMADHQSEFAMAGLTGAIAGSLVWLGIKIWHEPRAAWMLRVGALVIVTIATIHACIAVGTGEQLGWSMAANLTSITALWWFSRQRPHLAAAAFAGLIVLSGLAWAVRHTGEFHYTLMFAALVWLVLIAGLLGRDRRQMNSPKTEFRVSFANGLAYWAGAVMLLWPYYLVVVFVALLRIPLQEIWYHDHFAALIIGAVLCSGGTWALAHFYRTAVSGSRIVLEIAGAVPYVGAIVVAGQWASLHLGGGDYLTSWHLPMMILFSTLAGLAVLAVKTKPGRWVVGGLVLAVFLIVVVMHWAALQQREVPLWQVTVLLVLPAVLFWLTRYVPKTMWSVTGLVGSAAITALGAVFGLHAGAQVASAGVVAMLALAAAKWRGMSQIKYLLLGLVPVILSQLWIVVRALDIVRVKVLAAFEMAPGSHYGPWWVSLGLSVVVGLVALWRFHRLWLDVWVVSALAAWTLALPRPWDWVWLGLLAVVLAWRRRSVALIVGGALSLALAWYAPAPRLTAAVSLTILWWVMLVRTRFQHQRQLILGAYLGAIAAVVAVSTLAMPVSVQLLVFVAVVTAVLISWWLVQKLDVASVDVQLRGLLTLTLVGSLMLLSFESLSAVAWSAGLQLLVLAVAWFGAGIILKSSRWTALIVGSIGAALVLGSANIQIIEAYFALPTLSLLAAGILWMRRDSKVSSWSAWWPALAVGLVPSYLALLLQPEYLWRPLTLAAVALGLAVFGVLQKWFAPILASSATAVTVAITQLFVETALMERWVSFAVVGVLLLTVAATYEKLKSLR